MSDSPATLVFFHAHPDDEASSTSGTIAKATARGHRVVVVYATNGDHGECPDDLAPGETIVERRKQEAQCSADSLGVARLYWLGYADSGMTGWEQNAHEHNFMQAPLDEAARRLADILDAEDADVLIGYDWHGSYGHPDHIKVHRVAKRAAELAKRRPRELEVTMNRDAMRRRYQEAQAAGLDVEFDPDRPADDGNPLGLPEDELHWDVDCTDVIGRKRAALACHASQTSDVGMFLAMPEEFFAAGFGHEYYREPALDQPVRAAWPF